MKKALSILFIALGLAFFLVPEISFAQGAEPVRSASFDDLIRQGIIRYEVTDACINQGKCALRDIAQVIVNIGTFIMGIVGSVFLIMFIIGGFTWMTANGNQSRVQKGLDTIRDAFVGALLVLGAYIIVNTVISLITTGAFPDQNLENTINNASGGPSINIQTDNSTGETEE